MSFTEAIASSMGKYGTFGGRASRSEFWWFYLFWLLLTWAAKVAGGGAGSDGGDFMEGIVSLVLLVPTMAVSSRRLHDIGKSGWWLLIAFTVIGIIPLIIWWASEGSQVANEFGEPVT